MTLCLVDGELIEGEVKVKVSPNLHLFDNYEGTAATGCSKTFDTKMKRKQGSPNYVDLFL